MCKIASYSFNKQKYDMLHLLVLVLPHSNPTFHFFLYLYFLKNEDAEAQRISGSLCVLHNLMKQD